MSDAQRFRGPVRTASMPPLALRANLAPSKRPLNIIVTWETVGRSLSKLVEENGDETCE